MGGLLDIYHFKDVPVSRAIILYSGLQPVRILAVGLHTFLIARLYF